MSETKKTIGGYKLPVYVLTKTGCGLTDEGVETVRNMILGEHDDPHIKAPGWKEKTRDALPGDMEGVLIHSGFDLLNAGYLAGFLEKDPNSRLVVSYGDSFTVVQYGPDEENGLPPVIRDLKKAADMNIDSWTLVDGILGASGKKEA